MNHSDSFSTKSSAFTGSVVPIASRLMLRSEFYNGASHLICSWVNRLSLYWLQALYFFLLFCEHINLFLYELRVLMLYYIVFYEIVYRPYILYIIGIISLLLFFSLSLTFPVIHILFFVSQPITKPDWFFYAKPSFSCYNDMTNMSCLDWFFGSR